MKSARRLFFYLLVNIIVSAIVAGTVIYYYNRAHPVVCITPLPNSATLPLGAGEVDLNIVNVIGAGALTEERLVIQNGGAQALVLTGWYLLDNKGLAFTFPQLTLYPGVKVQVHSASGKNTPTDLYWGLSSPVWASGELAVLYDAHAIARAFFRVP
jgi:hypothetical protein